MAIRFIHQLVGPLPGRHRRRAADDACPPQGRSTFAACAALAAALLGTALPAHARQRDALVELINAYRAAPGLCEGRQGAPAPPLTPQPALARVQVGTGILLDQALERAGYPVDHAEAIAIAGAVDARAAMAVMVPRYCRTLLSQNVVAVGASRDGDNWLVVLAQPAAPSPLEQLPALGDAGLRILAAVNVARATARQCGAQGFAPAPPLAWNAALAKAAGAHSDEMAAQHYFSHQGKDGHAAPERALQAGYRWRVVGENIAAGQETTEAVVAGWLTSPGHCANIMSARFVDMGAAYAIGTGRGRPRVYWTQVLGAPL
jgi:uncharacterized protein YkwD